MSLVRSQLPRPILHHAPIPAPAVVLRPSPPSDAAPYAASYHPRWGSGSGACLPARRNGCLELGSSIVFCP